MKMDPMHRLGTDELLQEHHDPLVQLSQRMARVGAKPDLCSVASLSQLSEEELAAVEARVAEIERQIEVKEQYGDGARVVTPYAPSRKQRRAQAAAKRRKK
jgi:aspartate 1-decarboxylase